MRYCDSVYFIHFLIRCCNNAEQTRHSQLSEVKPHLFNQVLSNEKYCKFKNLSAVYSMDTHFPVSCGDTIHARKVIGRELTPSLLYFCCLSYLHLSSSVAFGKWTKCCWRCFLHMTESDEPSQKQFASLTLWRVLYSQCLPFYLLHIHLHFYHWPQNSWMILNIANRDRNDSVIVRLYDKEE